MQEDLTIYTIGWQEDVWKLPDVSTSIQLKKKGTRCQKRLTQLGLCMHFLKTLHRNEIIPMLHRINIKKINAVFATFLQKLRTKMYHLAGLIGFCTSFCVFISVFLIVF